MLIFTTFIVQHFFTRFILIKFASVSKPSVLGFLLTFSEGGVVLGGEIEPGTAVQQSGALTTKPRRALI